MKKILLLVIAIAILGYVLISRGPLLADGAEFTRVVLDAERSANGYVTIPFLKDSGRYTFINIAVDVNQDGVFAPYDIEGGVQQEWLVKNMGVRILKDEANNFSVLIPDTGIEERGELSMHVVLSTDELNNWDGNTESGGQGREYVIAQVGAEDIAPLYSPDPTGVRSGGFPYDLLGGSALAVHAPDIPLAADTETPLSGGEDDAMNTDGQGSGQGRSGAPASFDEFHPGVPDMIQGHNECVPTATANSLMWLADEYNFEEKMPEGGGAAVIGELKGDLNWDANGVDVQANYLNGKRAFTQRHNIPIVTHQVGGRFDTSIVSKIAEELKKGQDVEIDMEYGRYDADGTNYRRAGGHMVTVVGAWTAGNSEYLDIHDPLSAGPGSLDIYKIDGTRVENYRYQGTTVTYIRYAIAESPVEEATPTPTETPDDATPEPSPEQTDPPVTEEEENHDLIRDFTNDIETSFAHVAPGEYSEVYVSVQGIEQGRNVTVSLSGPAVDAPNTKSVTADDNGVAYFVFRIFNYGTYTAVIGVQGSTETGTRTIVVN